MAEVLRAVPDGWFSYNFTVFDGSGTPVARAILSRWYWRETTKLRIGATSYKAHRKEWPGNEFDLAKEDGRVVAMADKPSSWSNHYVIEHGNDRYELKKESVWQNTFLLRRDGVGPVGLVQSKGLLKREWTVKLTEEVPLEVVALILWLMVTRWKRELSAAVDYRTPGGDG